MPFIIAVSSAAHRLPLGFCMAVSLPFRPQLKCHLLREALPDYLSQAAPPSPTSIPSTGQPRRALRWLQVQPLSDCEDERDVVSCCCKPPRVSSFYPPYKPTRRDILTPLERRKRRHRKAPQLSYGAFTPHFRGVH